MQFCRRNGILIQGQGSAANSVVCYALEITAIDPVGMDLLFERFLSENRGEWPGINLDLPSEEHYGDQVDLAQLPEDDAVYKTLQQANTVGMFQVESRAQMASLPRNYPEKFYDVVVQVAIIRPGPIVGKMMHPYMRRRQKKEPVTYPHPSLEPVLKRTLGVPLFQEQLLRIAMTVANFSGAEAEELRCAAPGSA